LGFKLRNAAAQLIEFASFLEQKAAPYITTALALEWAMQHVDHQPSTWAQRLGFVRVFARHWSASDPRTEIPPDGLLPFRAQRVRPYLYNEEEIQRLLAAAKGLAPSNGLRPWTYHCLFGLLAVSGLRISEAIKGFQGRSTNHSTISHHRDLSQPETFSHALNYWDESFDIGGVTWPHLAANRSALDVQGHANDHLWRGFAFSNDALFAEEPDQNWHRTTDV
jgi:hypothetical protein